MMLDFVRKIMAEQTFSLAGKPEFLEFDDVTGETITEYTPVPNVLDIYATVKIGYQGAVPESYKALNLIIGDWVEAHMADLTKLIHDNLKNHFSTYYPESDASGLDEEDTAIWTDQLDYLPVVNPGEKTIEIEIELVLTAEPMEEP